MSSNISQSNSSIEVIHSKSYDLNSIRVISMNDKTTTVSVDNGCGVETILVTDIDDSLKECGNVVEVNLMKSYVMEEYKGFYLKIVHASNSYYCGYVLVDKHSNTVIEKLDESDLYIPHGDYTTKWGFDCAHYDDINITYQTSMIIPNYLCISHSVDASYKTYNFARSECHKIIDSIIHKLSAVQHTDKTIESFLIPMCYITKWKETFNKYDNWLSYVKLMYVSDQLKEIDFVLEKDVEEHIEENFPWFTKYLKQYHLDHSDKVALYKKLNSLYKDDKEDDDKEDDDKEDDIEYMNDLSNLSIHDLLVHGM